MPEPEKPESVARKEFLDGAEVIERAYIKKKSYIDRLVILFGLCGRCTYLTCREYEYHDRVAMCTYQPQFFRLTESKRVTKCTNFLAIGQSSLFEMGMIAHYITDTAEKQIGFKGGGS